jgi:cytochrome c oxidase assembly protein subunit 15
MNTLFVRIARFGAVLALAVVMLGAWVRLHDAGLGCPDWPGCYGRLLVPDASTSAQDLGPQGAVRPLETGKAWREMIHRYLAGTLVLVTVALAAIAWLNRKDPEQPWRRPLLLVGLIVFQALLGMWTVTLLLKPLIVVAHLFGGLATLVLLASLGPWRTTRVSAPTPGLRALGRAAAAVLVLQIFLGGWTSSNYAALACPDFPKCQTQWWPALADYRDGFVLWRGLGQSYEGGVLDHPARVAIHFTHRLGAVAAFVLIVLLGWRIARDPATRADGLMVLALVLLQVSLGVSIVVFGVPLAVAVAHNGGAALLLLAVVNANQRIRQH